METKFTWQDYRWHEGNEVFYSCIENTPNIDNEEEHWLLNIVPVVAERLAYNNLWYDINIK